MFKPLVLASVALAFAVSTPAFSQDQDHDHGSNEHEHSTAESKKADEPKKVCTTHVETGSVMPKRKCRMVTKESLAQEEREREEQLRSRNSRGAMN